MTNSRSRHLSVAAIALAAMLATLILSVPSSSRAEDSASGYPARAIRIIPFPAGGTADILPRIVAEKLRERWKQPVVVENRSGAGGNIGAEFVAASPPDGYTLLASPPGPIVINETLYKALPFRPADLEPITVLGSVPNVLTVRPGFPAQTAHSFIEYSKANPGKVSFASQGNGSTSHLTAVLFQKLTGSQMVHIPYRGTAPALQDIMGDNVDMFFDNLGSSLNLHLGGKIRILAVGGAERASSLPDIPTVREAGVPDFQSVTWFALLAPHQTPAAIVARLNTAITEILTEPDVRERFSKIGVQAVGTDLAATAKFINDERSRWGAIIKTANVVID